MRSVFKIIALSSCFLAVQARAHAPPAGHSPARQTTAQVALAGLANAKQKNLEIATAELDKARYASDFNSLPQDLRYQTLLAAGLIAWQDTTRQAEAHGLLVQATSYRDAKADAWLARSATAFAIQDYGDSANCIAVIAKQWPGMLSDIADEPIYIIDRQLAADPKQLHVRQAMLQGLFDGHWTDRDGTPNTLWRTLARMLIEQGRTAQAATVAARITSARVVLSLIIDKRFDPVTRSSPERFDVDRTLATELAAARVRVADHPDQLRPLTQLQELLLDNLQFEQVIAVTDDVIARVRKGGKDQYTDFDDRYVWILDQRARAMMRLGRWDDAAEQWTIATRRPEGGGMNVSQILNLGEYYADRRQDAQAADMVAELGNMSDYGRMEKELVQLKVAVQQHDQPAVASHLATMQSHQADAINLWQRALLINDDIDGAAALLIRRLKDEALRNNALLEMQDYAKLRMTPVETEVARRWYTTVRRRDVQDTLARVGRIEHLRIAPDQI